MNKYIESLKEFYQNKVKLRKSKRNIPDIEIEKIPYYYNKDYLDFLEHKILEEKGKILIAKYNVYYDLETEIDAYEEIEKNIRLLKEERDRIKFNIERKEETKMKHIQKLNDDIEGLKLNYSQLPEMVDKKLIYTEIENKREDINSILNNDRCIILKEHNKKKIYTLTTDYEPISGNEIVKQLGSHNENENRNENRNSLGETITLDNSPDGFAESKGELSELTALKSKSDLRAQTKYLNNENENNAEEKPRKMKMTFVSQNRANEKANAQTNAQPKVSQTKSKMKFSSGP